MAYYRTGGGSEKVASGTATISTSSTTTVSIGFKPKKLTIRQVNSSQDPYVISIYDEDYSTSKSLMAGTSTYLAASNLGVTNNNRLYSINDDGFTYNKSSSSSYVYLYYFAIG